VFKDWLRCCSGEELDGNWWTLFGKQAGEEKKEEGSHSDESVVLSSEGRLGSGRIGEPLLYCLFSMSASSVCIGLKQDVVKTFSRPAGRKISAYGHPMRGFQ
jgi:hypothetical protein